MRIAVAQTCPVYREIEQNLGSMIEIIERSDAELIVFPELALTGYLFTSTEQARPFAREVKCSEVERLRKTCVEHRKSIVFGHLELSDDKLFNSAIVIDRTGAVAGVYRKTHLFHFERQVFAKGDTGFQVFDIALASGEKVKLGVMICYDWRFPESARSLALKGAQIIAIPSNIVTRTGMLHTVLQTRAFENKVIVAFADRVGSESNEETTLTYRGESCIINYNGDILSKLDGETVGIAVSEVSPKDTISKSFSDLNDIFKDRRPDLYKP